MKKTVLISALSLSLLMAGCQDSQNTPENIPTPTIAEPEITVVTSFYPLAFFTQEIVGNTAKVITLAGNKNPHSYQLSPQDRVMISNADLLIYQGVGLESWTEDLVPELEKKGVATLEASHDLALIEASKDKHDEESHDEHEEEEHDEHNHGGIDPHTWLDPLLAQQTAQHITEKLIAIHPAQKEHYLANLTILEQKLQALDSEYQTTLANCSQSEAIISHNAFGYLEARYNFDLHPIAGLSPSDEPSAKLLAELKELVEHDNISHMLTEENNIQKYADMLSAETGIQSHLINPMGVAPTEKTYFQVARENLTSLSNALECQ